MWSNTHPFVTQISAPQNYVWIQKILLLLLLNWMIRCLRLALQVESVYIQCMCICILYIDIVSYELSKQRLDWFISTRDDLWRSPMWIHVHRSLNPISRLPDKWLEWGQRPASNTGPAAPYKYRYRCHTNTNKGTIQIRASNSQIDHFAGAIDWPQVIWRGGRQIVSQCPVGRQTWLHFEPHTSIYIYILILIVLPLRKCFFSSYSELWVIVSRNTYNSSWYFDRFWSFDISHLIRHFSQHPTFMLYPNHLIPPRQLILDLF